jgi:hypothetical protein
VENLRVAAISRSTNIETYLFQLHGEQKLLFTTHQAVLAMAQETFDDPPKFGALPPPITKPLYASIEEATRLLQDAVNAAQQHHDTVTYHRDLLGHAITSLTLHHAVAAPKATSNPSNVTTHPTFTS